MRAYVALTQQRFRATFMYPFYIWSQMFGNLIRLGLFVAVWASLLRGQENMGHTVAYLCATFLMDALNFSQFGWRLPMRIRSGEVIMSLLKPVLPSVYYLFEQWGDNLVQLLLVLPVYIVIFFMLPISLPEAHTTAWFALSAFLGHLVFMATSLSVASLSFWTMRGNLVMNLQWLGFTVFSGKIIPLTFMPEALRRFCELSPFAAPFHTPAAILVGQITGTELYKAVSLQVVWLVVMTLLAQTLWSMATRKLVVQGG